MIPAAGTVQNLSNETASDGIRRIAEWNLDTVISTSQNNLTLLNDTLRVTVVLKQSSEVALISAKAVTLVVRVLSEGNTFIESGFNVTIDPFFNTTEVFPLNVICPTTCGLHLKAFSDLNIKYK